jgi:hypothetical protein
MGAKQMQDGATMALFLNGARTYLTTVLPTALTFGRFFDV